MAEAETKQAEAETKQVEVEAVEAGRRVVVTIDESEESLRALEWALPNIVRAGDKVHILHAQPPAKLYGGPVGPAHYMGAAAMYVPPEYMETMKKYEEEKSKALLRTAKDKCKEYHVNAEGDVIVGEPREAICAAVEQLKADLLIMGSHGYGAVKRALLGSVSDYCVHHAKCPVVVVRGEK